MREKYTSTPSLRRLESRLRFVKGLIHALWARYDKMWSCRCERVHDDTDAGSLCIDALDTKIRYYFRNRQLLFDSGDFDRFHMGLTHTLSILLAQKKSMVTNVSPSLDSNSTSAQESSQHDTPYYVVFQAYEHPR